MRLAVFTSTPAGELVPGARRAAARALELDNTLGEAHLDLARAYTYEWKWKEAEGEYRRALDLSPSSAGVHLAYGYYLLETGRLERALAEARIGSELDPISPQAHQFTARMLYYLGRYDDSIDVLRKGLALDPSLGILHQALGLVYLARPATYAQGVAESERARELMEGDPWTTSQLGYAYALVGRTADARSTVRQLEQRLDGNVRALPIARIYVGLGDRDLAFVWLQKAVVQQDVALLLIGDPVYDTFRADRRFQALLNRANLNPSFLAAASIR